MQSIFILGRQPALGLAELESLFGSTALLPWRPGVALVDVDHSKVDFSRLGGSVKSGTVLAILDTTDWNEIETYLADNVVAFISRLPEGKLSLGISTYGFDDRRSRLNTRRLLATGLTLKKVVRKTGRPVRLVPNTELELSSASVLHNGLAGPSGCELILASDGSRTVVAKTTAVQDIDYYTLRDRGRPKRDARVGMLPPKLAQIIINLAVGDSVPHPHDIVLDPFCGTGVVLQEAVIMGFHAHGSDIEPRMIDYSRQNLEWLAAQYHPYRKVDIDYDDEIQHSYTLDVGDATSHTWNFGPTFVAGETYLGRPFTSEPAAEILNRTIRECNLIISKFLANIGPQLAPGIRLCLAVPAWQTRPGHFRHLPLLARDGSIDSLAQLGYNRISFEHVRDDELLYFRKDQIVARELLVITKS